MRFGLLTLIFLLDACTSGDESLYAYGAADKTWVLQELGGEPFTEKATLIFSEPGALGGEAPCNSYGGRQTAPYPWFKASEIISTKRACPALPAETRYFRALENMTLSEVLEDKLILSTDDGDEMVFVAN